VAHVKIYTRAGCGYCTGALRFLRERGVAFEHVDATGDMATRRWLIAVTGQSTVPQIFIDGRPIGGFTDMLALARRGELDRLLAVHSDSSSGSAASRSG
jgi:glutaredoxin 3